MARTQSKPARSIARIRPGLEALEDRTLLSGKGTLPSGMPYPTAGTVSQLVADINYANNAGGAITINLAVGATFDLTSANNTYNGLPIVGGTKAVDLTINGNGDTIQRVSSTTTTTGHGKNTKVSSNFRLFEVGAGASLTLAHVTMKGASYSTGGAIYNQGTLKVIDGSTLTGNSAGAIANRGGTATVINSTLSGNSSAGGGAGISNSAGTVTVINSTLSGNASYEGGGIYTSGGTVMVSNSIVSGNSGRFGGGIYNDGGTVTVNNGSTLSGNWAYHSDYPWTLGDGGGIYNNAGTLNISNSTVSGNMADPLSGGVAGGIYNKSGASVSISNSILSGNTASMGGGILNYGTLTVSNSTLSGNIANTFSGDDYFFGGLGGGIYNAGTATVINSSNISGNMGGGLSQDVDNVGTLYRDGTSTISFLDGTPAVSI